MRNRCSLSNPVKLEISNCGNIRQGHLTYDTFQEFKTIFQTLLTLASYTATVKDFYIYLTHINDQLDHFYINKKVFCKSLHFTSSIIYYKRIILHDGALF